MRNDILGSLAIVLGGLVVAGFVGGAILRACVRWIDGFTPTYRRSCLVVLMVVLVSWLFGYLLELLPDMPIDSAAGWFTDQAVSFALRTTIVAGAVHFLIHRPDGSDVGYPRAFAIAASCVAIAMALAWVVLFVLAGALAAGPGRG
jgi:hypothetical protein